MLVWIKIAILWFLWSFAALATYLVQLVAPSNHLYAPWASALLTATATVFLFL